LSSRADQPAAARDPPADHGQPISQTYTAKAFNFVMIFAKKKHFSQNSLHKGDFFGFFLFMYDIQR
jgi:hypothetical protein